MNSSATTQSGMVSEKALERVSRAGVLGADEHVLAYLNVERRSVRTIRLISYALVPIGPLLLAPLIMRNMRALVLTERHLYVCKLAWTGGGMTVVERHPAGAFTVALSDGPGSRMTLTVEDERFLFPAKDAWVSRAQSVVAAGRPQPAAV